MASLMPITLIRSTCASTLIDTSLDRMHFNNIIGTIIINCANQDCFVRECGDHFAKHKKLYWLCIKSSNMAKYTNEVFNDYDASNNSLSFIKPKEQFLNESKSTITNPDTIDEKFLNIEIGTWFHILMVAISSLFLTIKVLLCFKFRTTLKKCFNCCSCCHRKNKARMYTNVVQHDCQQLESIYS